MNGGLAGYFGSGWLRRSCRLAALMCLIIGYWSAVGALEFLAAQHGSGQVAVHGAVLHAVGGSVLAGAVVVYAMLTMLAAACQCWHPASSPVDGS